MTPQERMKEIRKKYRAEDGHYYCHQCPIYKYTGDYCKARSFITSPKNNPYVCEKNIERLEYPRLTLTEDRPSTVDLLVDKYCPAPIGTIPVKTAAEEPKAEDMVNHPTHYTSGGIECIDAIYAALCKYDDPIDAWLTGQVIKYLWRAPLKGKYKEDIRKAMFYLKKLEVRQDEC